MISCRGAAETYVVRERARLLRRGVRREIAALRDLWLGTPAMFPLTLQLGLLGALAVAYVALGWWALVHFERRARHHGLEGF